MDVIHGEGLEWPLLSLVAKSVPGKDGLPSPHRGNGEEAFRSRVKVGSRTHMAPALCDIEQVV